MSNMTIVCPMVHKLQAIKTFTKVGQGHKVIFYMVGKVLTQGRHCAKYESPMYNSSMLQTWLRLCGKDGQTDIQTDRQTELSGPMFCGA